MQATCNQIWSIAGLSIQGAVSIAHDGGEPREIALPAGKAGTLTTRTGDREGEITGLPTGHGLVASDVVDIHWAGGCQASVTVDTAGANNITFNNVPASEGDVLPAASTAVVVAKQVVVNVDFDGDDMGSASSEKGMIGIGCDQNASVKFEDSGNVTLMLRRLVANQAWGWVSGQGVANPLTGNAVDEVKASNGSTTAATLKIGVALDSTP